MAEFIAIWTGVAVFIVAYRGLNRVLSSPDEPDRPRVPHHPILSPPVRGTVRVPGPPSDTQVSGTSWWPPNADTAPPHDEFDDPADDWAPDDTEFTFDPAFGNEPKDDATEPPEFTYTPPPPSPEEERERIARALRERHQP